MLWTHGRAVVAASRAADRVTELQHYGEGLVFGLGVCTVVEKFQKQMVHALQEGYVCWAQRCSYSCKSPSLTACLRNDGQREVLTHSCPYILLSQACLLKDNRGNGNRKCSWSRRSWIKHRHGVVFRIGENGRFGDAPALLLSAADPPQSSSSSSSNCEAVRNQVNPLRGVR